MKRFFVFLFPIAMLAGCVKDNSGNNRNVNTAPRQDSIKTDTIHLPDSVVYRANLFKKSYTKISDITFEGDSASYYCTVYHINDTSINKPWEDSLIFDYKAKYLDTLYLKADSFIFFNRQYSYFCLGQVFKVDYKDKGSILFVMP